VATFGHSSSARSRSPLRTTLALPSQVLDFAVPLAYKFLLLVIHESLVDVVLSLSGEGAYRVNNVTQADGTYSFRDLFSGTYVFIVSWGRSSP
jgi:hypothetical protein